MSESIWKKEISFKRKPKPEADPEPRRPVEPLAPSPSVFERELSLRRRHETEAVAVPAEEPAPSVEELVAEAERAFAPDSWVTEPEVPEIPEVVEPEDDEPVEAKEGRHLRRPAFRAPAGHPVKRVVGLKIGASQVAAARVANNGAAELLQVARIALEPGVVVGGELRDPEALAAALKKLFADHHLPKKGVRLGIASNRIGVRNFELEGIDDQKQLENAIRFRAQEALPIPLDEAVLDYRILEEHVNDEGVSVKKVMLVVAYRELVERYVAACRVAGITLDGVDLEAFALLRAISAPSVPNGSALVAVAIGHDRSTFAVSDGSVCQFTRVLEWGGSSLNVALARALDVAPSEVDPMKHLVSLAGGETPQGVEPAQYALAVDAVRKQVHAFARELVSSLQFYQQQRDSLSISEVVITGGTAALGGLAAELEQLVGVHVRVGDPLARLKVAKKVDPREHAGSLAVAIGLGIED